MSEPKTYVDRLCARINRIDDLMSKPYPLSKRERRTLKQLLAEDRAHREATGLAGRPKS